MHRILDIREGREQAGQARRETVAAALVGLVTASYSILKIYRDGIVLSIVDASHIVALVSSSFE